MTQLYASNSSEYFGVREPGRLYVYRDSFLKITHRVHDRMAGELISLADNGDCFFRSPEGIFRLRLEKGVRAERCLAVASLDGSAEGGTLKGFAVKADGEQVAYEQVVPAQKFSSKLKRLLGQKSAQADVGPTLHRFVMSRWSGRTSNCYYETVVDPRVSAGIVWWTSADFGFLSVLERDRDGRSTVRLIDVIDESVVSEFVMEGRLSRDRFLTANGSIGFGIERDGRRAFVIWTYAQERFLVSYPKESRVLHLTKNLVVFLSKIGQTLIVKDFKNKIVTEVSLEPLQKLGIQFLVHFNPRETIELVTYQSGKLRVHHTDLEALPIDAKRWQLLGESQRATALENQAESLISEDQAALQATREAEQRSRLAQGFPSIEESGSFLPSGELPAQFAPPRPQPSALPPPVSPAVLALETLDLSTSGEQHRPPSRPVAPEALRSSLQTPASRPSVPPESRVQASSEERVQGFSIPKSSGRSTGETLSVVQKSFEKAKPAAPPSAAEELDPGEALERLRMRYIAGELTREDYYNEKSRLEKRLRSS